MLISIDHGNKQIKTNHRTFVSGLRESDTKPPFGKDVLFYKGKYYKLHMSIRTIQDLEHGISNPKAETILLIARELDISIDAILFPNIVRGHISKTAMDFFAGKSEAEVQKYVSLCQQADKLKTDK